MFEGSSVALITPFKNGDVDYDTLTELVAFQIENGTDVLVPCGTTGEASTLSTDEHLKVIEQVIKAAAGKAKVVAGTGANCTEEAVELTIEAQKLGADGSLQVTPYYVKPSDEGIYRHFKAITDKTDLPLMLYNIPGRTGKELSVDLVKRLADFSSVVAIKEAGGSVERVTEYLLNCDITVVSGDDGLTVPMMALGGSGVVSVMANIVPADVKKLVELCAAGNYTDARALHDKMYPFFKSLFIENNPAGIKAAMDLAGKINFDARLPVCELSDGAQSALKTAMQGYGIL